MESCIFVYFKNKREIDLTKVFCETYKPILPNSSIFCKP